MIKDTLQTATSTHQAKLEAIRQQLDAALQEGTRVHIRKGGVSHFVPLPGDRRRQGRSIDISSLDECLIIDVDARTCIAEPGATFEEIVSKTLPYGLMPAVVPELKGITLGGAIAGCSIESTSYRYGTFHDSCLEYEILTGTGEILTCSPTQDPVLFHSLHASYGTLGILTRLTFRLLPAQPYVHLQYRHFATFQEFEAAMWQHCRQQDFEFIDGIIHSPVDYVLCLGRFAASAPYASDYSGLRIFYKSTLERREDYMKAANYFFRYDTDCHWLSRTVPFFESPWFRLVGGKFFLGSTNLLFWTHHLAKLPQTKKRPDVVCDIFLPKRNFSPFIAWYQQIFDYYPLWIVPGKLLNPYPWLTEQKRADFSDEFIVDCAIYGKPNSRPDIDYSQELEEQTDALGGIKTLISTNHYTPETFWRTFDHNNYTQLKQRVDPAGLFAELYTKFNRTPPPDSPPVGELRIQEGTQS